MSDKEKVLKKYPNAYAGRDESGWSIIGNYYYGKPNYLSDPCSTERKAWASAAEQLENPNV